MPSFQDIAPPGEQATIDSIVETIINRQNKNYKPGKTARRALHGKSLGVIKGTLTVRELASDLRVGIFAQPQSFQTIMRFSNGGLTAETPDILPNVRGMALKVYGVEGQKVLPGEENSTEQDFIMANYPSFFVKTIDQFGMLIKGRLLPLVLQNPAILGLTLLATSKIIGSLLAIDYFSQVPHRFADRACRFALIHQAQNTEGDNASADIFDKDYLRHDLEKRSHKGHSSFVLCVQFQQQGESISDSSKIWRGPQVPLADLELAITTGPILESDGEQLSFNPARSLAVLEPLAWPARLRLAVYKADTAWRLSKNRS